MHTVNTNSETWTEWEQFNGVCSKPVLADLEGDRVGTSFGRKYYQKRHFVLFSGLQPHPISVPFGWIPIKKIIMRLDCNTPPRSFKIFQTRILSAVFRQCVIGCKLTLESLGASICPPPPLPWVRVCHWKSYLLTTLMTSWFTIWTNMVPPYLCRYR